MYDLKTSTGGLDMNIKFKGLVLGTALSALAFSACQSTGTNTTTNTTRVNSNTAVVVNDNTNSVISTTNTTTTTNTSGNWNANISRADLATTNDLRDSTINVDVNNDVVTLRGTVATAAQKTRAEQVAKVEGVKSVTNNLKVAAGDTMTNQMTGGGTGGTNSNANANTKR
jgi:hypothetical protein